MVEKRDIVTNIILSIITCGIYGIIWFISLTDDIAYLSDDQDLKGAKAFLYTLITCGIYGFFWAYKIGKDLYKAKIENNMQATDNSILYIILQIFGLGIVTYSIAQNEINEIIDYKTSLE